MQRIRTNLPPAKASSCLNINIACNDNCLGFSLASVKELCEFSPISVNELSSLLKTVFEVMRFRPDSAILTKECYDTLLPVITDIVNLSLNAAIVPTAVREAVVDFILTKDSLDHIVYKNFRPISNLSFISKATEKVAAVRRNHHLEAARLHEIFQSAYKKGNSTETALTRIHNDILRAIDD